jgi:hypothetical protein
MSLRSQKSPSKDRFSSGVRGARRIALLTAALIAGSFGLAAAHDMFLKPTRFFVPENSEVRVRVLNGTFDRSENSIARNRLRDASVVTPTRRVQLDTAEWTVAGDTSTFHVHTRGPGTYVIGASMHPTVLALPADDFNMYLKEDGIPDVLAERQRTGELQKPARERYHKHVKAMIQVGTTPSQHYATAMGYPAELIPVENPYSLSKGGTLSVRTLVDGKPAANQYVLYGARTSGNQAIEQKSVRSGKDGIARIPLSISGTFYVKFINMTKVQGDTVDYESKWATLTFQVR